MKNCERTRSAKQLQLLLERILYDAEADQSQFGSLGHLGLENASRQLAQAVGLGVPSNSDVAMLLQRIFIGGGYDKRETAEMLVEIAKAAGLNGSPALVRFMLHLTDLSPEARAALVKEQAPGMEAIAEAFGSAPRRTTS